MKTSAVRPFALMLFASMCLACSEESGPTAREAEQRDQLYAAASTDYQSGRVNDAISKLVQAVELDADHVETRMLLGRIFLEQSGFPQAKECFERVLEQDGLTPKDEFLARICLARTLMTPGNVMDLDEALRELEKVRAIRPESRVLLEVGKVQFYLGQLEAAEKSFREALEMDPRLTGAATQLGALYYLSGRDDEAIAVLQQGLDGKFDDKELEFLLMLSWERKHGEYPGDLENRYWLHPSSERLVEQPAKFVEVGAEVGVDLYSGGRGSAWADFDGDGDLDLAAVGNHHSNALYRNDGDGKFTDVAKEAGVAEPVDGWGCLFADYDNDGDEDLLIVRAGWQGEGKNSLYQNQGDGTFRDVSEASGIGKLVRSGLGAAWADFDLDGDLDLYVANGVGALEADGRINSLYRNEGDGTFEEIGAQAGVAHPGAAIGCAFGDYDLDGDPDLYIGQLGSPNVLFRNEGDGTFTEVTSQAGGQQPLRSYVPFFFDYDADGDLDIFATNFSTFESFVSYRINGSAPTDLDRPALHRNNGDGTFTEVGRRAGLSMSFGSMAGNWGDIDNDGFPEIYLGNGGPPMERLEPNALLYNNGDGTFSEITRQTGTGHLGKGHGTSLADFDDDGDLDIYSPNGGYYIGDRWHNALYRNDGGNTRPSIVVECRGTKSNRDGVGAQVFVKVGDRRYLREVSGGAGFGSLSQRSVHCGLGDGATRVDRLEVYWPVTKQRQVFENVPANKYVVITEGDPVPKLRDFRGK
ncbi:MAG: FG-GAP-like repeat-containing protein [Planctomycetota bacterium]